MPEPFHDPCDLCGPKERYSFNWKMYEKGEFSDRKDLSPQIQRERRLRFGSLMRCQRCTLPWYLDDEELMLHSIPYPIRDQVLAWADTPLPLDSSQRAVLRSIGASSSLGHSFPPERRYLPCSVLTVSGELLDPALVVVGSSPPIFEWPKRQIPGSAVDELAPSRFALSRELRLMSSEAQEFGMGFAPTPVRSPDGREFALNGSAFSYTGELCRADELVHAPDFEGSFHDLPILQSDKSDLVGVLFDRYEDWDELMG